MSIYTVRRKNENNEKLMRRFKKTVQNVGIIKKVRKKRYYQSAKTKIRIRQEAIKRTEYREKKIERILWA
ncbi:30S ribosomal protein S21 [Candidatus Peregrinibacteria bacterium]|nr:MAG: 30S ribosomal protein S21 [Candidatus Peregrinibacteria bacterium]